MKKKRIYRATLLFAQHDLLAIPVVDADGCLKGLVTVDDIVDVVQEEATEDAQKFGGMEALDAPYLKTGFLKMIRKRAGWLGCAFLWRDADGHRHGQFRRRDHARSGLGTLRSVDHLERR